MNCCVQCFCDPSLIALIESTSINRGNCDFCNSANTIIVNCDLLSQYFDPIFELYDLHPNAEKSLKINRPFLLYEHLNTYWSKLFNKDLLDAQLINFLVDNIARNGDVYTHNLFSNPVEFRALINPVYVVDALELKWDSFATDIKEHNRFFLNERLDTDLLQSIFERLPRTYPYGTEFYRGRISDTKLLSANMGKPPLHQAIGGRANPAGIPYLYLSNDLQTTLYETRISLHETLTVGKFISLEAISLVSLKNIDELGPFEIQDKGFTIEEFVAYRPYLQKLESELSKPVRKQDLLLDYLPTQFLCEFIKSKGFDAVEYKSAMNPSGSNLALFNDSKVECVQTKFYQVDSLTYNWNEL